jgi:hypothetical protein
VSAWYTSSLEGPPNPRKACAGLALRPVTSKPRAAAHPSLLLNVPCTSCTIQIGHDHTDWLIELFMPFPPHATASPLFKKWVYHDEPFSAASCVIMDGLQYRRSFAQLVRDGKEEKNFFERLVKDGMQGRNFFDHLDTEV